MVTYILVLFLHVGIWGENDSNASTNIPGFTSLAECQEAGAESLKLTKDTKKETTFVCLKQTH